MIKFKYVKNRKVGVHETVILEIVLEVIFVTLTPSEIAVVTHFCLQTWRKKYSSVFLYYWRSLLVTTSKFGLLTIRWHIVTRKHLFPYPPGGMSGLRKPKKDKHQY